LLMGSTFVLVFMFLFLYVMQEDNNFNYIISFHKINKNIIIKIDNKKHYIIFYHKKVI
jgi:hypothetical protein